MKARHAPDEDKALHYAPEDKSAQPPAPVGADCPIAEPLAVHKKSAKRRKKRERRRS